MVGALNRDRDGSPGSRWLGRYELVRPLALGGMAEVFLARRRAAGMEKRLVIKRMRPEIAGSPRLVELFAREARLSMLLVHQNIVPVFDFGKIEGAVFLAMECIEGKDLGMTLARAASHRLPPLLGAFIAAECCQALDYAHRRKGEGGAALGIVHRDVTPRNVLLSWSGEVKLTDFGIAALAGDPSSRLLGTPHYMAPEQARREPVGPRADLYAIGLVLREAVSGLRPRPGTDHETTLDAARRAELLPWPGTSGAEPPIVARAAGTGGSAGPRPAPGEPLDAAPLPAALVAIIDRATCARPDDRYPDARAMLDDLDAFIVGERAAHRTPPPARMLADWLAAAWDGAPDDREPDHDAALWRAFDDGGPDDAAGTGTARSLAMTAGDDAEPGGATVPPIDGARIGAPRDQAQALQDS